MPAGGKIGVALDIERLALEYDRRVTGVETAAYSESTGEVALASTRGLKAGYRFSICYGYLVAIAESGGDSQTGFGFTAGRTSGSLDARGAAEEAASMAVDLLGARQVETARVPVLFDNLSTAELVSVLGEALSGESVAKGRSFLAGRLGEKIASEPGQHVRRRPHARRLRDSAFRRRGRGDAQEDRHREGRPRVVPAQLLHGLAHGHRDYRQRRPGVVPLAGRCVCPRTYISSRAMQPPTSCAPVWEPASRCGSYRVFT